MSFFAAREAKRTETQSPFRSSLPELKNMTSLLPKTSSWTNCSGSEVSKSQAAPVCSPRQTPKLPQRKTIAPQRAATPCTEDSWEESRLQMEPAHLSNSCCPCRPDSANRKTRVTGINRVRECASAVSPDYAKFQGYNQIGY